MDTRPQNGSLASSFSPARFEDLTLDIQTTVSHLSQRYAPLHEIANARQVTGAGERVSGGGGSDPTGETATVANERLLKLLTEASRQTQYAWNSLAAAHKALTTIERIGEERAERTQQAQPAEQLRDQPATRGALVQVLIRNKTRKQAEFAEEMARLDARIRPLFEQIDLADAKDVIKTMEVRAHQIELESSKEIARLQREVTRLRGVVAKAEEKERAKVAAKRQQSQWQRGT